jgi:hypothetical protein
MVMNEPGIFSCASPPWKTSHRRYEWINAMGKRRSPGFERQIRDRLIEVRDAAGIIVHSKSLSQKGSFVTAAGKPGVWRILLVRTTRAQ